MRTMPRELLIGKQNCLQAGWKKTVAVALVLAILHLAFIPVGWAQERDEDQSQSTASQFGLGTASFFLTIPYGLAKVVYATFGGIIGGFTYALTAGNEGAAKAVWDTSLRGTYVITPEHLKGDKAVRFFGVPPDEGMAQEQLPLEPAPAVPEPMK